jgi:glycosidase
MKIKNLLLAILAFNGLGLQAQTAMKKMPESTLVTQPQWAKNAVIYEVNVRQFSPEGTFKEVTKALPRLKKLGVDILWLMPIHPIGEEGRKGSLGSYYAVKDYDAVNPEFGSMDDFLVLVKNVHANGMKIIIDWVANHTSPDNKWVKEHPEYYLKDKQGKFTPPVPDWTDVIDLDYNNAQMRAAMQSSMILWLKRADIDGFRCDVAEMVPMDFWTNTRKILNNVKPEVFMLAEGEKPELHDAFNMTYSWKVYHALKGLCRKEEGKDMNHLCRVIDAERTDYPQDGLRMFFTSNHDENSWNATEFEAFGKNAKASAVLAFTLPGMPLIYNGQEAPYDHRLKFFDRDPIEWNKYMYADFYESLVKLHKQNPAINQWNNKGSLEWLIKGSDKNVMAFMRTEGKNKVVVVLNLSDENQEAEIKLPSFAGFKEWFTGNLLQNGNLSLPPNSWRVYVLNQ